MSEHPGPRAARVHESAILVDHARANVRRSRELIARSLALISTSLEGLAGRVDPPCAAGSARLRPVPAPRPRSDAIADLVDGPGLSISTAAALSGLDSTSLWLAYISIGGDHSAQHVQSYLQGEANLPQHDTRILAHVINEHFRQQGISNPISDD